MYDRNVAELESYVVELERVVRKIALRHNDLVVSVSLLWAEIQRSTTDTLTKHICTRRLEEMSQLLYQSDVGDSPDLSSHLPANEPDQGYLPGMDQDDPNRPGVGDQF